MLARTNGRSGAVCQGRGQGQCHLHKQEEGVEDRSVTNDSLSYVDVVFYRIN